MRWLLFVLLLVSGGKILAQGKGDTATITSIRFYSAILKEDGFIDIYIPISPKQQPELIFVLDGAAHFTNVINILHQLAEETGDQRYNQKMVVGIGNIWLRDRDYTPTHVQPSPFLDSMAADVSGSGMKFISFLEKELVPYIVSHYPAIKFANSCRISGNIT